MLKSFGKKPCSKRPLKGSGRLQGDITETYVKGIGWKA